MSDHRLSIYRLSMMSYFNRVAEPNPHIFGCSDPDPVFLIVDPGPATPIKILSFSRGFLFFRAGYWANSGRILTFDNEMRVNMG